MKKSLFAQMLLLFIACSVFEFSNEFKPSMVPARIGDKWGFVDWQGKFVINPQFSSADFFQDGLALVSNAEGAYGYINPKGEYIITAQFLRASPFCEGLACVVHANGPIMYIDKTGALVAKLLEAESADNFHDGLARFMATTGKWGFISKVGNIVISPQFDIAYSFKEGIALVASQVADDDANGLKWGAIDKSGKSVANPQFVNMRFFSNGLSSVSIDGKQYGYINKDGVLAINPQFQFAGSFYNGMAPIRQGSAYGFIGKDGRITVNPQFDEALDNISSNGLIAVKTGNKWGYVDTDGKYQINPQFEKAYPFMGDRAIVSLAEKYGFIDKLGKYICNPQFDEIPVETAMRYMALGAGYIEGAIETDYFDVNSLYSTIKDLVDIVVSRKNVRGTLSALSANTTDLSRWGVTISPSWRKPIKYDSKNVSFSNISVSLDTTAYSETPVYETYNDYWGNKSKRIKEYRKDIIESAKAKSITIKMELRNKGEEKAKSIATSLYELLSREMPLLSDVAAASSLTEEILSSSNRANTTLECYYVKGKWACVVFGRYSSLHVYFFAGDDDYLATSLRSL